MPVSIPAVALICHPQTPSELVRGLSVRVHRPPAGPLAVTFALEGDLARLRIPSLRTPHRAERLWEHTCFEVFAGVLGESAYYELNFAPSGEWAAYAFRAYREGEPLAHEFDPRIAVRRGRDRLELDALIRVELLPRLRPHARLRLALCAVVEDERGALSFWALQHRPGKPDFHHPDAFALEVEPLIADALSDAARGDQR